MARVFVLVDALPGMEEAVFQSFSKVTAIVAKRKLPQKAGNAEFLVLVEGADPDSVEKTITGYVRGIGGVAGLERVTTAHPHAAKLSRPMREMEQEVAGRKKA